MGDYVTIKALSSNGAGWLSPTGQSCPVMGYMPSLMFFNRFTVLALTGFNKHGLAKASTLIWDIAPHRRQYVTPLYQPI